MVECYNRGELAACPTIVDYGADKRRVVLPIGDSLLVHRVRQMRTVPDDIVVVLRPGETDLAETVHSLGCRPCYYDQPDQRSGRCRCLAVHP